MLSAFDIRLATYEIHVRLTKFHHLDHKPDLSIS